jgi:hypothetical protein
MDVLIAEVEAFGPYVKRTIEDALSASTSGKPVELQLTLTLAVSEAALREFNVQIQRLQVGEQVSVPGSHERK